MARIAGGDLRVARRARVRTRVPGLGDSARRRHRQRPRPVQRHVGRVDRAERVGSGGVAPPSVDGEPADRGLLPVLPPHELREGAKALQRTARFLGLEAVLIAMADQDVGGRVGAHAVHEPRAALIETRDRMGERRVRHEELVKGKPRHRMAIGEGVQTRRQAPHEQALRR